MHDRFGTRYVTIKAPDDVKYKEVWRKGHTTILFSSKSCARCHGYFGIDVISFKEIE